MSRLVQEDEPKEESLQANFKVILAMKLENSQQQLSGLHCQLKILDKVKTCELPQSEGQFFELSDLPIGTNIEIEIFQQNKKVGELQVPIPAESLDQEETELSDVFKVVIKQKNIQFKIKYYIIILNKRINISKFLDITRTKKKASSSQKKFLIKDGVQTPSTIKFIQSQQEHQDSRYNESIQKRILDGRNTKSENQERSLTPTKKDIKINTPFQTPPNKYNNGIEVSQSQQVTPVKSRHSPYSKYSDKPKDQLAKNVHLLNIENGYLKKQVYALETNPNEQVNVEMLKVSLKDSEQKRIQLQQILKNSIEDNTRLKEEVQQTLKDALDKKQETQKLNTELTQKNGTLQNTIEDLQLQITQKDNYITELELKNQLIEDYVKLCREQQNKLEAQDKRIRELSDLVNLNNGKQNVLILKITLYKPKQSTKPNLKSLQEQLQKAKTDLLAQQQKNNSLQTQLDNAQNRLQLANNRNIALAKIQEQNDRLKQEIKELKDKLNDSLMTIDNLRDQIKKLENRTFEGEEDELRQQINKLKLKVNDQGNLIDAKNEEILQQKQQIQELKLRLEAKKNNEDSMIQNANLIKENAQLLETVNELTQQLRNSNKQLLEARLTAKDYEHEVENKEAQANNLKRLILQMKERGQIYMPDQKDAIDKVLGTALNSKEDYEQMRSMFVKESEGVYQFGSKKIYVKVEQDKLKIRSGGGYMSLEEFLQLFSQTEMEKIQRQDPLTNLSKNKAIQRKMDDMRLVNSMKEDTRSPNKQKK